MSVSPLTENSLTKKSLFPCFVFREVWNEKAPKDNKCVVSYYPTHQHSVSASLSNIRHIQAVRSISNVVDLLFYTRSDSIVYPADNARIKVPY